MSRLRMCALVALFPATAVAQRGTFRLGPLAAPPGERASGYLEVPAGVDSGTRIPVTVLHGRAPGPVLALVAGTHGDEVASIVALQRLRREVDPARLSGTLILVHVANLPAFHRRAVYYGPVDGKNLNRVYPGRPDGTQSERIADVITREVIGRVDYLADLHGGDGNEDLVLFSYWSRLGRDARADSLSRMMALAWGTPAIVVDTEAPADPARTLYTQNTAHLRGIPAITTEAGRLGLAEDAMVERNVQGAYGLLRGLGMWPGASPPVEPPVYYPRTDVVTSPVTGVWRPRVQPGQRVVAGSVLGLIVDYFGDSLAVARAPFDGEMLYVVVTPAISRGEPLGMVGVPSHAP